MIKIVAVVFLAALSFWFFKPKAKHLKVGDVMPSFSLKNQEGKMIKSTDFSGKSLVVYFYPKDDTPGCTKEACSFRDYYDLFQENGVSVIGISADDVASHKSFATKYSLPFVLLADPSRTVHKKFGVGKELGIMTSRITFIVNEKGFIIKIFKDNINAKKHVTEALDALKIKK